jgi:hypothetical protein
MRGGREKDTPSDGAAGCALLIALGATVAIVVCAWILRRAAHLLF